MFEIKALDLGARIGVLRTKSGSIETPYLFPVVDPMLKKQNVSVRELKELGFNAVITNAYIALKGYGLNVDIHKAIAFDGVVMTDSGAYQLMVYGDIDIDNRSIVEFQCRCGSDIGVPLDIPTKAEDPRDRVAYSVLETCRRLEEVLDIVSSCRNTLWVAPIQGGVHLDLLRLSAKRIIDRGLLSAYSIVALGSPTTLLERFRFEKVIEMIGVVRSVIPPSIPLHLFGAGHPMIIPFAVALGVDTMDSASYAIYARDGRYMTRRGTYRIEELDYFPCSCPVCSKYEPRDLVEMSLSERTRLIALHNLYVLRQELRRVKQAIKEGRLWEYLEEVAHSHPAAKRAFDALLKYYKVIASRSPASRGEVKALMIFDSASLYNPRAFTARRRVKQANFSKWVRGKVALVPLLPKWKPLVKSSITARMRSEGYFVVGYAPVLGPVPSVISEAFPFSQYETSVKFCEDVLEVSALEVQEFVERYCDLIEELFVMVCKDIEWSVKMGIHLYESCCRDRMIRRRLVFINCGEPYDELSREEGSRNL